ncbi:conserved hypothetical protein [delta proteobacterium NaphS2]|nr:conserved hypothetical protein [delta proteobacterium NaphS2]
MKNGIPGSINFGPGIFFVKFLRLTSVFTSWKKLLKGPP